MIKKLLLTIICITSFAFTQKEFGKVTLPLGRVQVQKCGTGDFKRAMPRMSIHEKDIVKTLTKWEHETKLDKKRFQNTKNNLIHRLNTL